jgi:hypothetical protein
MMIKFKSGSHRNLGKSTTRGSDRNSRRNFATGVLSGAEGVPRLTSKMPGRLLFFSYSDMFQPDFQCGISATEQQHISPHRMLQWWGRVQQLHEKRDLSIPQA